MPRANWLEECFERLQLGLLFDRPNLGHEFEVHGRVVPPGNGNSFFYELWDYEMTDSELQEIAKMRYRPKGPDNGRRQRRHVVEHGLQVS